MLKVTNLTTGYGESQVLFGISLKVKKSDVVSLVGSNGAGKTTLINAISGIYKVWEGKIEFLGQDITNLPYYKRVELGIIQCPEGRRLFSSMTVLENIQLGAYSRRSRNHLNENMKIVYEIFPILYERRYQIAGTLSGGEQQMCAIGRALMGNPELLILDEPSLGLAPIIVQQLFKMIEKISKTGVTILLVEQNVNKALLIANEGYVIENGQVTMKGGGKELLQNNDLRKAYFGI